MEKEFVPYEQALALKELGFDESTYTWRQHGNGISGDVEGKRDYYNRKGDIYTALPLYQQAFRWFREKYGISISISINWEEGIGKDSSYGKYACSLQHKSYDESIGEFIGVFEKYEKAELKCLKKLIKTVKLR